MTFYDDPNVGELSADDYLARVDDDIDRWRSFPVPKTLDQLRVFAESYPELARRVLPSEDERSRLGLSRYTGRVVPAFDLESRERLVATLARDADLRAVIAQQLREPVR